MEIKATQVETSKLSNCLTELVYGNSRAKTLMRIQICSLGTKTTLSRQAECPGLRSQVKAIMHLLIRLRLFAGKTGQCFAG